MPRLDPMAEGLGVMRGTMIVLLGLALLGLAFGAGWVAHTTFGTDSRPPPPAAPVAVAPAAPPPVEGPLASDEGDGDWTGPYVAEVFDEPLALLSTDRSRALGFWSVVEPSPLREAYERALALPPGIGHFEYLAPVWARTDEALAQEPLGWLADRSADGRLCRFLRSKVPLAQGGSSGVRKCNRITTNPPAYVALLAGEPAHRQGYVLFDTAAAKLVSASAGTPPEASTVFFALENGAIGARVGPLERLEPGIDGPAEPASWPASARLGAALGAVGVSEVRPYALERGPLDDADLRRARAALTRKFAPGPAPTIVTSQRLRSEWLSGAVALLELEPAGFAAIALLPGATHEVAIIGGIDRRWSVDGRSETNVSSEIGMLDYVVPLPGVGGYYLVFGHSETFSVIDDVRHAATKLSWIVCRAEGCKADAFVVRESGS